MAVGRVNVGGKVLNKKDIRVGSIYSATGRQSFSLNDPCDESVIYIMSVDSVCKVSKHNDILAEVNRATTLNYSSHCDSNYIYTISGTNLTKLDKSTLITLDTLKVADFYNTGIGLTVDDNFIYVLSSVDRVNYKVSKITKDDLKVVGGSAVVKGVNIGVGQITNDSDYIYTEKGQKLNKNTLEIVADSGADRGNGNYIDLDVSEDIMYISYSNKIFEIDRTTMTIIKEINVSTIVKEEERDIKGVRGFKVGGHLYITYRKSNRNLEELIKLDTNHNKIISKIGSIYNSNNINRDGSSIFANGDRQTIQFITT